MNFNAIVDAAAARLRPEGLRAGLERPPKGTIRYVTGDEELCLHINGFRLSVRKAWYSPVELGKLTANSLINTRDFKSMSSACNFRILLVTRIALFKAQSCVSDNSMDSDRPGVGNPITSGNYA